MKNLTTKPQLPPGNLTSAKQLPAQNATAPNQDVLLKSAVLLLESLSHNVMSGDIWALALIYTRKRAQEVGLSESEVEGSLDRLMTMINKNRDANPMRGMF